MTNKEHESRFKGLLERDDTYASDSERKALFWVLAGNDDLFNKVEFIYDFQDNSIKPECFENEYVDFCSSSCKLITLAFNLYNGYNADVLEIFTVLDEDNFNLALEAINIRFNRR